MEYKKLNPLLRCSSLLVLLFLAISAQADNKLISAEYDVPSQKLKTYEINTALVLSCNYTSTSGSNELKWLKNGKDVSAEIDPTRFRIIAAENKFIIDKTVEKDAGKYECSVEGLGSAEINVVAEIALKLPTNTAVVEGEKLTIHCLVIGTDPIITWTVGNESYNSTRDRVTLKTSEEGKENAVFQYEVTTLDDRGNYTCSATNLASEYRKDKNAVSSTTFVRVKGKLAALWPFLGICAEVFILCAIILIYEKKRNKQEMEDSDTDQSPEQEKLKN